MADPQTIAASDARNNFSDLISQVQYQGATILIERYGEVVAKMVPVEVTAKQVVVQEKQTKVVVQAQSTQQFAQDTAPVKKQEITEKEPTEVVAEKAMSQQSVEEDSSQEKPQDTMMSESVLRALQRLSELTKSRRGGATAGVGTPSVVATNQAGHYSAREDATQGQDEKEKVDQDDTQLTQPNQPKEDKVEIIRKRIEL